ncbi:CD48 antigen [Pimephales promelas]|uniref:CD48 antigen n=1 Tax=Pimephales promelas TaxID=90988 RepID=UPI0019558917|nr:CD48 antigen [Pimephales promelas]
MRSLWEVSGLYICLILSRLFNAVTSVVYVENGTSLTLKPNIQGKPEEILWTHNGNKVAENDLIEFLEYGQFKGRSEIEVLTGQLTVNQMTSRDSGTYRSIITINGKLQNSDNEVKVIDAVPEPVVICHLNDTSRALLCSVSQSRVSYTWTGSGSAPQSGQELRLSGEETPDSVYTCTVKNEVSERSSNFSLKDCDTDGSLLHQNIILVVPLSIIIAVVILVIIVVAVICFKRHKRHAQGSKQGTDGGDGEKTEEQENKKEVKCTLLNAPTEDDSDGGISAAREEKNLTGSEQDRLEEL